MNSHAAKTILLVAAISFGLIYASSRTAYAHNFTSDESASFLAKVPEIQTEAHLALSDWMNATTLQWHLQRLTSYWTSSDTAQMAERNQLLAKEIPGTIANITTMAMMHTGNATTVDQLASNLASYMNESIPVRIDPPQLQNVTVGALTIKNVLDEVLNDYGNATGAKLSLTNMSNMANMSSSSGSGGMSGMQTSSNMSNIVNAGAYESAQGLTNATLKMWSDLKAMTASNVSSSAISALDTGFPKLKQLIDDKATANQIMDLVHGTIHPNFITAYHLQLQGEKGATSSTPPGGSNSMNGSMNSNMTGGMNGTIGANMTMAVHIPHGLMMYVNQSADVIHSNHKASAPSGNSDYKTDTKYTLTASGTATSTSVPSKTADAKISLDLSTWKTVGRVVTMDIMGGSVTVEQTTLKVHSGVAAYIINGHVLYAVALITPADNPGLNSVQLLKIRAVLPQDNSKLPLSASDQPLSINAQTMTMLSPGWLLPLSGQVALSP